MEGRLLWSLRRVGTRLITDRRVQGAGLLSVAAGFSAILALVTMPLLTRLYAPATYGTYAVILAVGTVLSTAVSGRYEMAVVLVTRDAQGDAEAGTYARLAVMLTFASVLVVALVCGGVLLVGPNEISAVGWGMFAIPLVAGVAGLATIQVIVQTRLANYPQMAGFMALRVIIMFGVQLALGIWMPTLTALLCGLIGGYLPASVHLFVLLRRMPRAEGLSYREAGSRHSALPRFQAPAAIARSLETNAVLLSIQIAYGSALVGLYALCLRVVLAAPSVLVQPVSNIYLREAAGHAKGSPAAGWRLYRRLSWLLAAAGLASGLLLLILSDFVIGLLGPEWSDAGPILIAVIPTGVAAFLGSVATSALVAYGRTRQLMWARFAMACIPPLVLLASAAAGLPGSAAILASSVAYLILSAGVGWYGRRVVKAAAKMVG